MTEDKSKTDKLSLPEMMFAPDELPVGVRVLTYQSPRAIKSILKSLDDDEVQILRESPFRKILEIVEKPVFSEEFVGYLLTKQLKVKKIYEAWFLFAWQPIRFSLREFAILTGLPCGQESWMTTTKKTVTKKPYWPCLLGKAEVVTVSSALKMLRRKMVTDKDIRIKIACLAILSSVLLPTSSKMNILREHADSIEDLDEFFAFPWGRLAFKMLIGSIKEHDEVSLSQNKTIPIKGFALALQLLMFEAVPALVEAVQVEIRCCSSGSDSDDDDVSDEHVSGNPTKKVNEPMDNESASSTTRMHVKENDRLGEEVDRDDIRVSSSEEQDERKYDDDGLLIIRPPPLLELFDVGESQTPPVASEAHIEEDKMWEELAFHIKSDQVDLQLHSEIEKEISADESTEAACRKGNHELCLDLEIGLKCIHCCFVLTEIRGLDVSEWGERKTSGRRKNDRSEEEGNSFTGNLDFEANGENNLKEGCESTEGTVWDKIPGVKSEMYPHQQEGFEFIWRNLAGTIMLNELKDFENSEETGGCIMSHAPGTGKTRLTITFLQAYLECFPNCKPVIIAPASLLLTWEEEFKKWNISIPFHNISSLELTGRENSAASKLLLKKNSSARSTNEIRMLKISSWIKSKSILGISYDLYVKLAGVKDEDKKTKVKPDKELEDIREILMGRPGLLVLDEAHTPRNQRSCIWKTLSKVETQKRILLSGTPFQNNFKELGNVLGIARPKYLERLMSTLKKSGMTVTKRGKRALGEEVNNRGIEELKAVMLPFVHVHKGSILQKSLPGLRECVVVLNPPDLQRKVLESIEVTHNQKTKNVFETEHKLSLVSVHPSLVSHCKLTGKEKQTIDEALLAQLKKVRLDPNQSVKTKFLMEFIKLCVVIKEKVLVFSQYIDPLKLIMKHLVNWFKWTEGEEVLYMHGKLEQKQRQTLINEFNDPKSKAKVLLASTKACSEGINLVGASRVILLDVVWNPAVERQAISRAYRIGQKRIVYTYHLVAKGTPEGTKYCKQAQKDRISELVFACSSRPDKGKEKIAEAVTEDKVLDTMVKHMKLGDMFDNLIVQPKEADLVEGFSILMP